MGLQPATRLGPYEIISAIGAGGMGEVYRARDTRLGRTVAIKVLSEHLSGSSQIRERFDREAKAIASLSHPHICPLYDVGQQDATDFLVMEYVDGETLARRLERGPLRTEQVLQYAIQLTDALDTAHRHGVIHRDLKPGNIMITAEGIKLLDFGLAKMSRAEPVAGLTAALTEPAPLTIEGAILGTLHYMAPEQLEGTEADARSDIFALGVVIYEMVTGRKAFNGKNPASVISAIMTAEPASIISIQPAVLPALDHVVRMCLAKAPDARWQTAHDVLIELKWILETGLRAGTAEQFISGRREVFAWAVAGILLLALGAVSAIHFNQRVVEEHPVRFAVRLPEQVTQYFFDMPVVSPNGQRLAFTGASADGRRLMWIRSLDSAAAEPLAGTEDAYFPFWSPDSHFIAFCTGDQKLKKIDVSGGPVEIIADASFPCGGSWNRDGVILFASKSVLQRVSAAGGDLKPVRELDKLRQEISQNWPHSCRTAGTIFIPHIAPMPARVGYMSVRSTPKTPAC